MVAEDPTENELLMICHFATIYNSMAKTPTFWLHMCTPKLNWYSPESWQDAWLLQRQGCLQLVTDWQNGRMRMCYQWYFKSVDLPATLASFPLICCSSFCDELNVIFWAWLVCEHLLMMLSVDQSGFWLFVFG